MVSTAEISMYPFQENFQELIKEFIKKLNDYTDLNITPGATATVIVGDYDRLMECITEMMRWSHAEQGRAVFVVKFLPGYDVN